MEKLLLLIIHFSLRFLLYQKVYFPHLIYLLLKCFLVFVYLFLLKFVISLFLEMSKERIGKQYKNSISASLEVRREILLIFEFASHDSHTSGQFREGERN